VEIKSRIFEKYTDFKFNIPLFNNDKVVIKEGNINVGDILLKRSQSTLKKSLYVPKMLNCKVEESEKYLLRMDGEYVERDEILAKKLASSGLTFTEITCPVSGVLELSRIKQGYIDILGEEVESVFKSDFTGYVNGINPTDGLTITSNAVCVDGVVSTKSSGKLFGNLEILGDGESILTESSLDVDYTGKIVWVGPYLYNRVAVELFERGAIAILTYSMSYNEFRNIGLPIMILGGFGSVHCDSLFLNRIISLKGKFVIVDCSENQLFVVTDSDIKNKGWFVDMYINQHVISRSTLTNGYIGRVLEYDQDSGMVMVDFGKKGTSLIHLGLLDFIDL